MGTGDSVAIKQQGEVVAELQVLSILTVVVETQVCTGDKIA